MSFVTGRERVVADARAGGLDIELRKRPEADDLPHAARLLGVEPREIVKSLVVRRHDGEDLFSLVPGDRPVGWAKLRAVVGVTKLRLPEPHFALDATGYERGTITSLGSTTA